MFCELVCGSVRSRMPSVSPRKGKMAIPLRSMAVGGQAILEGVMMRSPRFYSMAVRRSNGHIVLERRPYTSLTQRSKWWALPLLRGVVVLYESLLLGFKALMFSNAILMQDLESPHHESNPKTKTPLQETPFQRLCKTLFIVAYFIFAFALAIFLFKFLPLWVAAKLSAWSTAVQDHYWLFNGIDGVMKIVIFLVYLLLISLLPDIRRVFAYHGAEHQAIWAYEKGKSLTTAHAQAEHPEHPRCGTSFIIFVLLLSIVIYTLLPSEASFWGKLGQRIAALPLIAGLSYEVLKFSAKYETHWWMRWVTLPGLWLQKITTRKPTDDMEEVAIAALKDVLKAEGKVNRP